MLLRTKDRNSLLEIFSSIDFPIEVWAYGSRVSGSAHEGSDLDLVVRSQSLDKLPADIYMELSEKIKYSNIPILVQLFVWARLPESFRQNIEAQHEVLFNNIKLMANEPAGKYKKASGSK
ncbi:MAG: nucleotidyltransferase domain-containing protein [Bacteroidales bacterium]|nr:nucleotidyltransferase domain-containing protein [Bacteroidales bacterium]